MDDRRGRGALLTVGLLSVAACHKAQAPSQMPPTAVSVLTVTPQTVAAHFQYQGQAEASKHIEVRSLITGVIVERPFVEGSDVRRGALLYKIDPTAYQAEYQNAKGQLADAKARQLNAQRNLDRVTPLLAERAVAQKDVDDAQQAAQQANADVDAAQGAVDRALKDLNDADVRAEVDGRVGLANLQLGARVTGGSDLLTTLDQVDPIYVRFSPPDQDILAWRREVAAKRLALPQGALRVRATLSDGTVVPQDGKVTFADIGLQQQTGTQTLRATFPNASHILMPGQFVKVELLDLKHEGAILVPQRAVQQGMTGAYVYVVSDSNKALIRPVQTSSWSGAMWMISSGLAAGDKVVVDGTQKIFYPGMPVTPVPYNVAADTTLRTVGQDIPAAAAIPLVTARQ